METLVFIVAGGQMVNAFYPTKKEACDVIRQWHDWVMEKNKQLDLEANPGGPPFPDRTLNYIIKLCDYDGNMVMAVAASCVLAMYVAVPEKREILQERAVKAIEELNETTKKQLGEGEDWKAGPPE